VLWYERADGMSGARFTRRNTFFDRRGLPPSLESFMEEAQAALRHCIREMHVREQEEDELWRKWQNLGFPKRPYKRMPDAPSDAGNPRAGFYKIAEP
jgi:hypothetical protein